MKNENENKYLDYEFAPDSFELVNKDLTAKIHDEKFKTKPTTFIKDAFKRFCKSKSSVVAAIIIGVMLLGSIFVPIFAQADFSSTKPDQKFLEPKLFNAGTGWWDGCKTYKNQVLDRYYRDSENNILPSGGPDSSQGFKENSIIWIKRNDPTIVETGSYSTYAYDGYCLTYPDKPITATDDPETKVVYFTNYTGFDVDVTANIQMDVVFSTEDGILNNHVTNKIRVKAYKSATGAADVFLGDLTDGWINYSENLHINLSEKFDTLGIGDQTNVKIRIEGYQNYREDDKSVDYMLFKSIVLSGDENVLSEEQVQLLSDISFCDRSDDDILAAIAKGTKLSDANAIAGYGKDSKGQAPVGYWQTNGNRIAYKSKIQYANLRYDLYDHTYGIRKMTIGATLMDEYIEKGWCKFDGLDRKISKLGRDDFDLDTYKFIVLDADKCPITEINSAEYSAPIGRGVWQFNANVSYYRYIGLKSIPRFLLGTDSSGFDLVVRSLNSLKTSLLVAIICVAICLTIGLVWGAISGYFGGTVDLIMERVTDIIAGLPSIILMTLILIIMGRNIFMFAFSVILTGWIGTASLTRTQFYRFRDREYVLASRTLGASDARLIFKHILPNGLGTIITNSVLRVPAFIASEATIAYLGIGLKTADSFGVILSGNQQYINSYPHLIVFPAIMMALLMISFNLFGNGLRDAVNPTLKGGE